MLSDTRIFQICPYVQISEHLGLKVEIIFLSMN